MRELQKYVMDICEKGKKPRGFNTDQCRVLVDVYNELVEETRVFLRDRQVYGLLKNRFRFPGKEKSDGFFVVWRKDLIVVVK